MNDLHTVGCVLARNIEDLLAVRRYDLVMLTIAHGMNIEMLVFPSQVPVLSGFGSVRCVLMQNVQNLVTVLCNDPIRFVGVVGEHSLPLQCEFAQDARNLVVPLCLLHFCCCLSIVSFFCAGICIELKNKLLYNLKQAALRGVMKQRPMVTPPLVHQTTSTG